jgi:hypothetical protein
MMRDCMDWIPAALVGASLTLTVIACDKEISREPRASFVAERSVSCTYAGYCYSCFGGFDGKLSCGFKFSTMCGGLQPATVRITPVDIAYESGAKRTDEHVEVLERTGECK